MVDAAARGGGHGTGTGTQPLPVPVLAKRGSRKLGTTWWPLQQYRKHLVRVVGGQGMASSEAGGASEANGSRGLMAEDLGGAEEGEGKGADGFHAAGCHCYCWPAEQRGKRKQCGSGTVTARKPKG